MRKNTWKMIDKKKIIICILFLIYIFFPSTIAVKSEQIDNNKNFLIVKMYMSTDIDFLVLYDSKNRDIKYIQDKNRLKNFFFNFGGFKNDEMGNLNKYVMYTDDDDVEYLETGNVLCVKNYKLKILYPIKRDLFDSIFPRWCVFNFEKFI